MKEDRVFCKIQQQPCDHGQNIEGTSYSEPIEGKLNGECGSCGTAEWWLKNNIFDHFVVEGREVINFHSWDCGPSLVAQFDWPDGLVTTMRITHGEPD